MAGISMMISGALAGSGYLFKTIGCSYILKTITKLNIGSSSSAGLEEMLKLGGVFAISNMTLDYLYQQGIDIIF